MVVLSIGRNTDACATFHGGCVVSRRREGGHRSYRPLLNLQASKKEQRGVIRLLAAEGVGGREVHRRMKAVYGKQWKRATSPPPKKSNAMHTRSGKVMMSFFYHKGLLLIEFLEREPPSMSNVIKPLYRTLDEP
ncbi:hypothetical protein TNCV_3420701 [Trichonephila clavipes]|nr:hypothetical protein TNCV_3420701 [Trichonephila clavipes]